MKHLFLFFISVFFMNFLLQAQRSIPLYEEAIPNSKPFENLEKTTKDDWGNVIIRDISIPTLTIFLPPKKIANGTAVIICPGGGYWINAIRHEGTDVAREFVKKGVAAFVLKYRIPDERWMINTSIGPLQDAERAMVIVRSHAKEWDIDTARIGVMGFSAGGHLASTLGTHYEDVVIEDPANISLRPGFMMLVYPMITGDTAINSKGLIQKLLGKNADAELIKAYSNETRVTPATPPTMLIQSTDDNLSVRNSLLFYEALLKNKVKAEMHLYQGGGHGYGMINKTTKDKWMERCFNWMEANGWLKKNGKKEQ
jgi:acetyl esterase/lipase